MMAEIPVVTKRQPRLKAAWQWTIGRLSVYILAILILFIAVGPFYWIGISSVKTEEEILMGRSQTLIPRQWTIENYKELLRLTPYLTFLKNSVFISAGSAVLTLLVSSLAAYGLHRPPFPGKAVISRFFLAAYLFPGILLLLPLYQMFHKVGLIDTPYSLMIVNVTFAAPLSTWLLASFYRFVPREVEESALMDGASRLQVLTRIILPVMTPGLTAVGIYAFIFSWSEYMFASVFLTRKEMKTLPLLVATLMTQYQVDWGLLAAGATAMALPVIILFALMGRQFVEGLISGVVKG